MHPPLDVPDRGRVSIGASTYVLAGARIGGPDGGVVAIGSRTYLGRDLTVVAARSVTIGDDVMGSDRLLITDVEPVLGPDGTRVAPVVIEDGVFLGTGAIVLPGVRVGRNSLVAAGAVVAQDVPPNAVVAGNPARVVRRFDREAGDWVSGAAQGPDGANDGADVSPS